MRYTVLLASLLVLSGCVHSQVYLKSWEGDKYKFCGDARLDNQTFDQAASAKCPNGYKAIAGAMEQTGNALTEKNYITGGVDVYSEQHLCRVYECKP